MPPESKSPLERDYQVQLDPPGPERIFRLESEAAWRERIRQEFRQRGDRAEFPKETPLTKPGEEYDANTRPLAWSIQSMVIVPNAVCYNPLYFEDKNTERYGWDACIFQPLVSFGKFYVDLVALPYKIGVQPPWACEFNTGYYLPGDYVPYYAYLPPLSWQGTVLQVGTIVGGIAIIP